MRMVSDQRRRMATAFSNSPASGASSQWAAHRAARAALS